MVRKACEGTSSGALGYRLCRFEYTEIPCLVSSIIWGGIVARKGLVPLLGCRITCTAEALNQRQQWAVDCSLFTSMAVREYTPLMEAYSIHFSAQFSRRSVGIYWEYNSSESI